MTLDVAKSLVRNIVSEAFNRRQLDTIDRYFAPAIADAIRRHAAELLDAFPDLHVGIEDLVAEGDRVAARLTLTGIHAAPFAGLPATNRRATWNSFRFYRIENGKVAETWAIQDRLGLLEQIGGSAGGRSQVTWAGSVSAHDPPDQSG
jgi:steroid delta-isomerase-like uncharacterized protein